MQPFQKMRSFVELTITSICILIFFWVQTGFCSDLEVAYIEFPPYYYTDTTGKPDGFLLQLSDNIFRRAGVKTEYKSLPAKRILKSIQNNQKPIASLGWFRTKKREAYAKYTRPIYVNKPLVMVCLKESEQLFEKYETLRDVLNDKQFTLGHIQGYSYGDVVDALINEHAVNTLEIVGTQTLLMGMLGARRLSYILFAPEEIKAVAESAGINTNDLSFLQLNDIPYGARRYIICSRAVSDDIIEKLNQAILEIVGEISEE